ncbi:uncharacterized protein PG998_011825 [Apiospora kogelbergensis]|uniref:uncharacterized protein n=1 Tax=Apiospora kogelbergensis TaxID=1337665 RepID=UPI0031320C9A
MSKALVFAGPLKPEVKLGVALSEFSQALDEKYRQRFVALRGSSSEPLNPGEVIRVTEELNQEGARSHRTWRPYSTRLCAFLHRIQIFASIGDVCIGGAQNLIASGVWCAIRVCLESTIGFLTYFDKLSAILLSLGTSWALHQDFTALFPRSRDLQAYTSSYVTAVVQLCKKAVVFSRQSAFKQFTASLTKSFEHEFDPLISELNQWGKLIEQRCYLLAAEHLVRADENAVERMKALAHSLSSTSKTQQRFLLKQAVLRSLLSNQNSFETQWRCQRRKGTCSWLLEHPEYKQWKQKKQSCTLWLEGRMGSGKSVALANIVADVSLSHPCAYIFCSSKVSRTAQDILGCIAYHFARRIPADDQLWDQVVSKEDAGLLSVSEIEDLILRATRTEDTIFIVIDALGECDPDEIKDISNFLAQLMKERVVLVCCSCRCRLEISECFLSNTTSSQRVYISMDNESRWGEIEEFIAAEIERKTIGMTLDEDLKRSMKEQLTAGAQGMYLWVSLQLEALLPERPVTTTNVNDIYAILCHLPASLPEAFDQALSRITDKRYGNIPFKLVTAAKRPLTLDEFQLALTVIPGDTDWDESKLPSDPLTVVHCCGGSLLEVDEESQTVHFIHHSAMVHLVSKSSRLDTRTLHFKLDEADTYMGAVCVTFLNCEILDQRISQRPQFISGVETTQKILESSFRSSQLWAHVARHIGLRPKGKLAADLDIGTMLYGIRPQPPHQSLSKCLFSYAHTHWLEQTSLFHPDMSTVWDLLTRILKGGLEHVELPWNPTTMAGFLDWAFNHKHHALIIYYLREESVLRQGDLIDLNRRLWPGNWQLEPNNAWFNDALARVICAFQSDLQEAPFHFLLQVGADPNVPHSELDRTPLELIVDKVSEVSRTELSDHRASHHRFLCQFLSQPLVLQSLRGPVSSTLLAETLRKGFLDAALLMMRHLGVEAPIHQDRDSSLAIAVHRGQALLVGELLNCGFSPLASRLQDITALELALDRHDGDMFVSLLSWTERNEVYAFDAMRLHGSVGLLHRAVVSGQPKMLEYMLKRGFNPSVKWPMDMATTTYETPIVAAIRLNRLKELGFLVKHYFAAHRYVLRAPVAPDGKGTGDS